MLRMTMSLKPEGFKELHIHMPCFPRFQAMREHVEQLPVPDQNIWLEACQPHSHRLSISVSLVQEIEPLRWLK